MRAHRPSSVTILNTSIHSVVVIVSVSMCVVNMWGRNNNHQKPERGNQIKS